MVPIHAPHNSIPELVCAATILCACLTFDVSRLSAQVSRAQINGAAGCGAS